jgi:hypothetical protein
MRRRPQDEQRGRRRPRDKVALAGSVVLVLSVLGLIGVGVFAVWVGVADPEADAAATGATGDGDQRQLMNGSTTSTIAPLQANGEPGTVTVVGDSLTQTAAYLYGPGEGAPPEVEMLAWQGWTAADAQPDLEAAVAAGRADTVVLALGTNDSSVAAGRDGWSAADVERFRQLLATPAPSACVVVVLPGYGAGIDPSHAAEMEKARTDLVGLADERRHLRASDPNVGATVVVDWQAELTAHPQLLNPDGIHLAQDPANSLISADAAAARTGLYWRGVASCDD